MCSLRPSSKGQTSSNLVVANRVVIILLDDTIEDPALEIPERLMQGPPIDNSLSMGTLCTQPGALGALSLSYEPVRRTHPRLSGYLPATATSRQPRGEHRSALDNG